MGVLANAAPLDDEATKNENGEARTLGVVTTGANLAGSALGAAGRVALALVGVAAAVKPLLVLGLGKCKWYILESTCELHLKCIHSISIHRTTCFTIFEI